MNKKNVTKIFASVLIVLFALLLFMQTICYATGDGDSKTYQPYEFTNKESGGTIKTSRRWYK